NGLTGVSIEITLSFLVIAMFLLLIVDRPRSINRLHRNSLSSYTRNDYSSQQIPKHDVVTRLVQLATRLSGNKKKDPLGTTTVKVVNVNGKNKLVWAGVSGALGYCLFDNDKAMPDNDIQFIDKKGKQFSGYGLTNTSTHDAYTVRAYQDIVHDCSVP
ncbi:hypothetical protein, partial [Shewanella surugensis]